MNKNIYFLAALILTMQALTAASAQSMTEVQLTGQPLSYTDKSGSTTGCGIRAVGIVPGVGMKEFKTFDMSANFWKSGEALVKVIGEITQVDKGAPGRRKRLPLYGGWVKAEGKTPAFPIQNSFKESLRDKGAYLYSVDAEAALQFIVAGLAQERIQVAISWDKKFTSIYYGEIALSKQDRTQVQLCLQEVLR